MNFCIPLVSLAILSARRDKAVLHRAGVVLFAHLSLMNLILFVQYFVVDMIGSHETETVNLYQTTVLPFAAALMYELTHPRHSGYRLLAMNAAPFFAVLCAYVATRSETLYTVSMCLAVAYGLGTVIYTAAAVRRFDRLLRENLSNTEGVDLRWLKRIVWCCLGILVTWTMASVADSPLIDVIYNISISAVLFALAFCVYRQEVADVVSEAREDGDDEQESSDMRNNKSGIKGAKYGFEADFVRLFNKEHIYLDKELNIAELSKRLGTNRTYVSRYLNNTLGTTFYDYVNRRRTEHAKGLLRETSHKLDVVATMSGFNSLITFRRAFYTYEGMTPGDYRLSNNAGSQAGGRAAV